MQLSVFGLDYLGSVAAGCLASQGHQVIAVDPDADKVATIRRAVAPVNEPGVSRLIKEAVAMRPAARHHRSRRGDRGQRRSPASAPEPPTGTAARISRSPSRCARRSATPCATSRSSTLWPCAARCVPAPCGTSSFPLWSACPASAPAPISASASIRSSCGRLRDRGLHQRAGDHPRRHRRRDAGAAARDGYRPAGAGDGGGVGRSGSHDADQSAFARRDAPSGGGHLVRAAGDGLKCEFSQSFPLQPSGAAGVVSRGNFPTPDIHFQ